MFIALAISAIIFTLIGALILIFWTHKKDLLLLNGKHILITGGSSGIGFALAVEAVKRKASCVTLLARNMTALKNSESELRLLSSQKQKIQIYSLDVAASNLEAINDVITKAEHTAGPIDMLVNCAGTSSSSSFVDTDLAEFHKLMDVNYYGTLNMCKGVVSKMIERKSGSIVITSSVAGQCGFYGYSAYSSSKFALRGLAECLRMELKPHNISVTLAFPPDTDTPGYQLEQQSKPKATHLISEYGGLFTPSYVAGVMLEGIQNRVFLVPVGFDGWMISAITAGMTSAPFFDVLAQVFLLGIFRLAALFYLNKFDSLVLKSCSENGKEVGKEK